MKRRSFALIALLLLTSCTKASERPRHLSAVGVTPGVWGVLAVPTSPGPHPAVLLVPGSYGWRPDYARFAQSFADSGFVALAIDYYAESGRGDSPDAEKRNWPTWQATVRNAVAFLDTMTAVSHGQIGLVGYSRGAFLSVSLAASLPSVKAVVDFYGGGSDDDPSDDQIAYFPPLLILHGEADSEIPVALAHRLHDRVLAHGGTVEMHLYPKAEHVFNGPWAPAYSPVDAADSWQRTITFLRAQLATRRDSLVHQ